MIINSKNVNLYKLLLNRSLLDSFEHSYLYPLLKQVGLYSGHADIILTANQLSQQAQDIGHFKKKIEKSLDYSHKYIKKSYYTHRLAQLNMLNWEIDDMNHENLLIEYHQRCLISEKYLFQSSSFFEKKNYELLKLKINKVQLTFLEYNTFFESVIGCIAVLVVYKIWKIECWYPLLAKLAFDSKEIGIAKYFIQIAKLEYNMILMLSNLFK
jgi:hypothetical protein